jgi:hypothetical protein
LPEHIFSCRSCFVVEAPTHRHGCIEHERHQMR